MNEPSRSYEIRSNQVSREEEEAEILWKLGKKEEAMGLIDKLLKNRSDSASLMEIAASYYLDEGQLKEARELIGRLEARLGRKENVLLLLGALKIQEHKYAEAENIFRELRDKSPDDVDLQRAYADILYYRENWHAAREVYGGMIRKGTYRKEDLWNYKRVIEAGAPQIGSFFIYAHRPQSQRDYVLGQQGSFWMYPWLKLGTGLTEERYRRGDWGGNESIDKMLITHFLESTLHYFNLASLKARWDSVYYDGHDFNEMNVKTGWTKWIWHSEVEYDLNRVVRDPIDALEKEGRRNFLHTNQRLVFFDRLEAGYDLLTEWFHMNGSKNQVNGASNLGYKISNEAYTSLVLWKKPMLSMNFHYKHGHWDEKFPGADQVIGFLADERVYAGGFYSEYRLWNFFEYNAGVTRGIDVKRKVDFLIWMFKGSVWVRDFMKLSFTYEYDVGDSGTAGPGNSQFMTTSADIYF